jgi:hypothetical protein
MCGSCQVVQVIRISWNGYGMSTWLANHGLNELQELQEDEDRRDGLRSVRVDPHHTTTTDRGLLKPRCPGFLPCIVHPGQLDKPTKFEPCPGSPLASRTICHWPSAQAQSTLCDRR